MDKPKPIMVCYFFQRFDIAGSDHAWEFVWHVNEKKWTWHLHVWAKNIAHWFKKDVDPLTTADIVKIFKTNQIHSLRAYKAAIGNDGEIRFRDGEVVVDYSNPILARGHEAVAYHPRCHLRPEVLEDV